MGEAKRRREFLEIVAHHEAGHAVVARAFGVRVDNVTLVAEGGNKGAAHAYSEAWRSRDQDGPTQFAAMCTDAKVALAGPLAQLRYRPLARGARQNLLEEGWAEDRKTIISLAGTAVMLKNGLELVKGRPLPERCHDEVSALISSLEAETNVVLDGAWAAVERVAIALLKTSTLDADELDDLIAGPAGQ
jgi:ATP-dependent Zn protease